MEEKDTELHEVWDQKLVPVVYSPNKPNPVLLRLPYAKGNCDWIKSHHKRRPQWNAKFNHWEIPRSWFDDIIQRVLKKYGRVYIIHPYQPHQKCAPACWNAKGFDCECSCMGKHHGTGNPASHWHVVSETFAVRLETRKYACRLLTLPENK